MAPKKEKRTSPKKEKRTSPKKEKRTSPKKEKKTSPGRYTKLGRSSLNFLGKYTIFFFLAILGIIFTGYGFVNDIEWMWIVGIVFLSLLSLFFYAILFQWLASLFRFFFP